MVDLFLVATALEVLESVRQVERDLAAYNHPRLVPLAPFPSSLFMVLTTRINPDRSPYPQNALKKVSFLGGGINLGDYLPVEKPEKCGPIMGF